jgi:hypothetical protein
VAVTGIVFIKLNGDLQRSKDGAKLTLGGKMGKPQTGYKLYGFSDEFVPGKVEFTLAHVGGEDLIAIQAMRSATLEFETDTGDSYSVANAGCTAAVELTGGDGEVALEFQGDPAELL